MDWWEAAPVGFKFDPTDDELIWAYLYPKVRTGGRAEDPIKVSDQVYKKPPWQFCTDLGAFRRHGKYYFFTELKKMNQNRVVRTVGSCWTWHESSSKKIFGKNNYIYNNNNRIIGYKKLLNFKEKVEGKEMKTTDWLMHEFSLPEKETLVLCVIQKKKKKEEMGSAYDTYPEPDPMSFMNLHSTTSAGGDPCPAPARDDQALDSEEEETRPSKKKRSDPTFDDDPFSGGDPCPGPAPAHDDQALDSEEEETRPNKKKRSDPTFDDDPFSGGYPCPGPGPAPAHDDQALDSEEKETRPSKKKRSDPTFDDDPFSGGDPCPAPAPAHDDPFELQVLDSEEEETRPSKKMPSDPKLDDHSVSVTSSSVDLIPAFWKDFAADLLDVSGLPDVSGLLDDAFGSPNDVFALSGDALPNDVFGLPNDLQTPPFEGDS